MSTPNCDRFEHVQTVFIPFFVTWLIVLGVWCFNTYYKNAASANSMHRMLTWLPAVSSLYTFLCIFYYGSCPWESFVSQLVAAALLMVVILKEPLNLLCLLLVAKGWCITRDSLHHGENRVIVVTVVLLYASVVFQLFGNTLLWMIPILVAYMCMLVNVVFSIYTNLRILKSQLLAMSSLNIDPLTTPAYAKYKMFKWLAVATAAYVIMEVVIHTSTFVTSAPLWVFLMMHQMMELSCVVAIGLTFRARPFNTMFQQVQEFGLQLAEQLLPSVTTVSINTLELSGPGMVEWNEKMEEPPEPTTTLIVVNPGGDEMAEDGPVPVQTAVYAPGGLPLSVIEPVRASSQPGPGSDDTSPADIALRESAEEAAASRADGAARTTPAAPPASAAE
mmetsp:Transcript_388/g.980  ORF Transcript_388/g.980 Transcript_388/m.980 type:complete len:390 (-) Transcript_388:194-1363(-)|eukprot:CAMPEP_0119417808 /NCGR_PEP_ID=MMETSP1335-20130426/16734_1 /TAXON_ID=259385 /ORGANISM="Chrysoculter rhomboideus, Strain RCC1486" /LENGTH=389 /DNA_ID=CAMNT_0007443013 /DNA_START=143 /DNA_END=1312 /DNA_ORIENTATION=-